MDDALLWIAIVPQLPMAKCYMRKHHYVPRHRSIENASSDSAWGSWIQSLDIINQILQLLFHDQQGGLTGWLITKEMNRDKAFNFNAQHAWIFE